MRSRRSDSDLSSVRLRFPVEELAPAEATGFGYTRSSIVEFTRRGSVVAETGGFGGAKARGPWFVAT